MVSLHVVKDGVSPIPYRFLTMHPPSLANDRNIPHPFIYQLICIISHNSIVKLNNTFCFRYAMYWENYIHVKTYIFAPMCVHYKLCSRIYGRPACIIQFIRD